MLNSTIIIAQLCIHHLGLDFYSNFGLFFRYWVIGFFFWVFGFVSLLGFWVFFRYFCSSVIDFLFLFFRY